MGKEPKQEYFKKSLSDFTFDVASGGAIRHLADRGYTVGEIKKMLDFPTPFERVQQTVWKYFLDRGIILLKEPERESEEEKYGYVTEYDDYGRKSFRRVVIKERSPEPIRWRESRFSKAGGKELPELPEGKERENLPEFPEGKEREKIPDFPIGKQGKELLEFLKRKCGENGEEYSYVSCDFGLYVRRDPKGFERLTELLEPGERAYIRELPWERKMAYHRLDKRMQKITVRLWEAGRRSTCYFIKSREKVELS